MKAEWKNVALGEVARVFNGKTPSKAEQRSEGHPVLKIRDVSELGEYRGNFESFVDDELAAKFSEKRVCYGDTLILNAAHNADYVASKTYYAQPPTFGALATGEWLIVRPGEKSLDGGFVHHWVTSTHTRRQLRELVNGIHLYPKDVARLKIPLPPLAEQQRIAGVLDRAEALRAKRRAALAQLDSLTQSLFLDLFGDPPTNPKGWPKVELGEVVKLVGGYAFKSEDFAAEGNAVVRISNLTGDGIDLGAIARIPDHKLGKGVGYKIHPGDILIAMSGATTGKLGVVPLELSEDLYLNQRVGNYRIRDAARIQREFLFGLLRSPFYQRFLWQLAAGVAQPNVSGWQLESAVVPLPPIPLQREFARRVTAVEALKTAQRASLAELDALFATLQHRAFRGEL